MFVLFAGTAAIREASGNVTELINGSAIHVIPHCLSDNVSFMSILLKLYPCKFFRTCSMASSMSTTLHFQKMDEAFKKKCFALRNVT